MDERDYARLKWAADPRWTNASRRATQKALADVGGLATAVRADGRRLADRADADRLAKVKSSVVNLSGAVHRAVVRQNVDYVMTDMPKGGQRALYDRMESAAVIERSLTDKLSHSQNRLATQRNRVAEKIAHMARLRARVVEARCSPMPKPRKLVEDIVPSTVKDKTIDALRLANRQVARTCDLISENMAMRDALNRRLTADVRQQAATVLELLAYGTSAQQEAAAFDRQYCLAVDRHDHDTRQNYDKYQRISNNVSVLESIRKKKIIGRLQTDANEIGDGLFEVNRRLDAPSGSQLGSQGSDYTMEVVETSAWVSLDDWIKSGELNRQLYQNKGLESEAGSESVSYEERDFTFPEENMNCLLSGDGDEIRRTRAMEAADYVCDTLGFSNVNEVLEYFTVVKKMELRLKKMISVRKHLFEIVRTGVESASELETDAIYCLPRLILRLEADIDQIRRDGLEVQIKKQAEVNSRIVEYKTLFNELWFHLDNMSVKLERCQVPVVRKYQLRKKKLTGCTPAMMDAHRMLEGLQLSLYTNADDGGGLTAGTFMCGLPTGAADVCDPTERDCGTASGRNSAVDACGKLAVALQAKVKACVVHIGGDFDAADEKQLAARAYFEYNQQYQSQRIALEKKLRRQRNRPKQFSSDADEDGDNEIDAVAEGSVAIETARAAAGIKTREQAKQESENIVEWFMTPKDTDNAKRTRKPISFRKSWIIV